MISTSILSLLSIVYSVYKIGTRHLRSEAESSNAVMRCVSRFGKANFENLEAPFWIRLVFVRASLIAFLIGGCLSYA